MPIPCAKGLSRVAAASPLDARAMKRASSSADASNSSATGGGGGGGGGLRSRMFALFVLIVVCCAVGLISVASLIQQRDLQLHHVAVGGRTRSGSIRSPTDATPSAHQIADADQVADPQAAADEDAGDEDPAGDADDLRGHLDEYECVGWRAQRDCAPDGGADPLNDRACNATVNAGESGFCLLRHAPSGRERRALRMHCDSLRADVRFSCQDFRELLAYGPRAARYRHDPGFSLATGRSQLAEDQITASAALQLLPSVSYPLATPSKPSSYRRAVLFVVYERLLESVYASVRALRAMGCTLPVELWYKPSETNAAHPLLTALARDHGCFLRELRDPRATAFYTKIHAVYYSAFEQVLLLDADNFAARDPTYLFELDEFTATGALFWPDFWRPSKTIFNIQRSSFVWEALDLPFVDMFEQESGQVVVDRSRHLPSGALDALMFFALHASLLERLRLVWGDKDLFRFGWMKANASFHMVATPPGAAGVKLDDQDIFCGVTMVQHDPRGQVVFLHRNQEKLSRGNSRQVWTHVQQFRMGDVPLEQYDVRGANGGRYFPQFKRCYGKDIYYDKAFTVARVEDTPFAELEHMLLAFVQDAADIEDRFAAEQLQDEEGEDRDHGDHGDVERMEK